MRNPPNYGSITKLKGTRRRPFMVRITTGRVVNFETKKAYNKQTVLGYYATRKEAMQALTEYNANPYNLERQTVTIREIWNTVKDTINVSDSRKEAYDRTWRKYIEPIADKRIVEVKTAALQDLFNSVKYGYSVQSVIKSVLNHIYLYAVQNDIIMKNYLDYVQMPKLETKIERNLYSAKEIRAIWKKKDERPEYVFTLILLYHGLRIKELRDLPKKAVNLTDKTLEIRQGKTASASRVLPIHERICPLIEGLMETDGPTLFNFDKAHYDHFVKKYLNHRPYDTRHTFASKANEIGLPKLTIQRIMGHKPDSVLEQAYIHLTIEEIREALNQIEY